MKLTTSYEAMPKPKDSDIITHDVNLTWLLQNLSTNKDLCFSIKRSDKKCHTPRRNADIDKALSFFANFYVWSENVCLTVYSVSKFIRFAITSVTPCSHCKKTMASTWIR